MLTFSTFRARLVFFVLVLIAFLSLTLFIFFQQSRDTMIDEAVRNLDRTSRLFDTNLVTERHELERYTEIVRDELRIKEYMYVVVEIGTDTAPLSERYTQQFGWLPVDSALLVSPDGKILSGTGPDELVELLKRNKHPEATSSQYIKTTRGIEMVATAPIHYRNRLLGYIILSRIYNLPKLYTLEEQSNGLIFVAQNDEIILGTLPNSIGMPITPSNDSFEINNDVYFMKHIDMPHNNAQDINFYFAVSEAELLRNIDEYRRITLSTIIFGSLAVMFFGLMLLRGFNRPLKKLLEITNQMSKGNLPELEKINPHNEMDYLFNHFADMLDGLRDKQHAIDAVQKELEELAITDTLTHLYNRRYLLDIFPKLQAQARRDNSVLSAIMLDLDHFKNINDQYGHLTGDHCLVEFSSIMRNQSRKNDYLFRLGGEEFLVLTLGENVNGVIALAEKIRQTLENSFVYYEKQHINMTVSCGISILLPDKNQAGALNTLLKQADTALYQSKQKGRNQSSVFNSKPRVERFNNID